MKVKCGTCGKEFELKENSQRILVGENNSEKIINICETCDKKIIEVLTKRELEEGGLNA